MLRTRSLMVLLSSIFLIVSCMGPAFAQTNEELRQEIETLKEGQKSIQKELQEIKKLISASRRPQEAPFKEVVINVEDDPSIGSEEAKIAVIEFSDYQ